MNCLQFHKGFESLDQGKLSTGQENELKAHAAVCSGCAALWESEHRLRTGLSAQTIPEPSPDFESRILGAAATGRGQSRTWALPVMGTAVAAVLAVGVFIGLQLKPDKVQDSSQMITDASAPAAPVKDTTVGASGPRTVKLAFNSRQAMEGVTLTLELPANVELAPFPGRHSVSWKVNLKEGDNVLALPLNVLFPGSGTLVAHLDDGTKRKTFRAAIDGNMEPSS